MPAALIISNYFFDYSFKFISLKVPEYLLAYLRCCSMATVLPRMTFLIKRYSLRQLLPCGP